jgi:protein-S-isoprenylcysteine O-methyltransferase Ste14
MIAAIGLLGAVAPGLLRGVAKTFQRPGWIRIAAAIRLTLGVSLIFAAPYCRPENYAQEIVRWLGVLTVAAGILILLLGQETVNAMIDWWLARPNYVIRVGALIAISLGSFLIYASGLW